MEYCRHGGILRSNQSSVHVHRAGQRTRAYLYTISSGTGAIYCSPALSDSLGAASELQYDDSAHELYALLWGGGAPISVNVPETPSLDASSISAFPNPLQTRTTLRYAILKAHSLPCRFKLLGKPCNVDQRRQTRGVISNPVQSQVDLPPGVSFLRLCARNAIETTKLFVVK